MHQGRRVLTHKVHGTRLPALSFQAYLERQFNNQHNILPAIEPYVTRIFNSPAGTNYLEADLFAQLGMSTVNTPSDTFTSIANKVSIDNSLVDHKLKPSAKISNKHKRES